MQLPQIKRIDFQLDDFMHSALVSVSGTSEDLFIHVQLIDSFIRKVFGVEHIRFNHQKGQLKIGENRHPFVYQIAQLISMELREESGMQPALRVV